jgi:uncharacterized protein Veg
VANPALMEIKRVLDAHLGEKVMIRANGGRKRTIERSGVLEETYPSVFTIRLDQDNNAPKRVSYSYADVLTETVELTICRNNDEFLRIQYKQVKQ